MSYVVINWLSRVNVIITMLHNKLHFSLKIAVGFCVPLQFLVPDLFTGITAISAYV